LEGENILGETMGHVGKAIKKHLLISKEQWKIIYMKRLIENTPCCVAIQTNK
jgi:hypothetical protein